MAKSNTATKVAEIDMILAKVTKNTYRFDADPAEVDPAVTTLYVAQSAFTAEPSSIRVTIVT